MDQNLKPTSIVLLLLFFGALLGAKLWAGSRAMQVPHLGPMQVHPDRRLFIQLDKELYAFAPEEEGEEVFDLVRLGISEAVGDFAFFGNGDLLIRKGPYAPGLLEGLRRFLRLDNREPEITENGDGGLFRCRLEEGGCQPFGDRMLNLNNAFHLALEPENDRVFLADPSRHHLLLLSPEGEEVDRYRQGLKFPNQILLRNGRLYVANTNHHALSSIAIEETGFGPMGRSIPVNPAPARKAAQTWPVSLLFHNQRWWVVNGDTNLSMGGIYLFSEDGTYQRRLELPPEADPVEIAALGEDVLVSDFSLDRIHRFDAEGEPLPDFTAPLLSQRLKELAQRREHFRSLDSLFSWLLLAALGVGFVVAFMQKSGGNAGQFRPTAEERAVNPRNPAIHWVEPDPKILRQFRIAFWLTLLMLPVVAFILIGTGELVPEVMVLLAGTVLITALFYGFYRWINGMAIGVLGEDCLILRDCRGRHAAAKGGNIGYSDQHLIIGDLVITVGLQNQSLFPKEELVQRVYPVMRQGRYVTRGRAQMLFMKSTPWITVPLLLFLLAALGMALFFPQVF